MYVKVYLTPGEFAKFMAGQRCEGPVVAVIQEPYVQVMVPRERITVAERKGVLGTQTLVAVISGDTEAQPERT